MLGDLGALLVLLDFVRSKMCAQMCGLLYISTQNSFVIVELKTVCKIGDTIEIGEDSDQYSAIVLYISADGGRLSQLKVHLEAKSVVLVPKLSESCGVQHNILQENKTVKRKLFTEDETKETNKQQTNIKNNKKKFYNTKQNCCVYCGEMNTKIARHLETVHKDEHDVRRFRGFPKGSVERLKIIDTVRKAGNYKHNIQSESRKRVVVRRTNTKKFDFKPCPTCKGYYSISSLRQHFAKCKNPKEKGKRCLLVQSRSIAREVHMKASKVLSEIVIPVMREDDVCKIVRYDELAILYGNRLCTKFKSQHSHDMIRAKLRLIGRFLIALKDINPTIENFSDAMKPEIFDDIERAINVVGGLDIHRGRYAAPATAFGLGILLKDCVKLFITECVKRQNHGKKASAKDLLKLLESELNAKVNKTVSENQADDRRQKKINLPETKDIEKLTKNLNEKRQCYLRNLEEEFTYESWIELTKVTLVLILIFNRRRPGELERSRILDYQSYCSIDEKTNKDLYESLSTDGREYAKQYVRFEIRGKKGRTVPVLLNREMKLSIDYVLKFRNEAGVPDSNPYIFGIPNIQLDDSRSKYLRAYKLLQNYASASNLTYPERLKATELRKHIATISIKLNINEGQLDNLQEFMGHADKIHREYYRQPLVERDIMNISKLLSVAQGKPQDNPDTEQNRTELNNSNETNLQESTENNIHEQAPCSLNFENLVQPNTCYVNKTSKYCLSDFESDDENNIPSTSTQNFEMYRSTTPTDDYCSFSGLVKRVDRKAWTTPEKKMMYTYFGKYIKNKKVPPNQECQNILANNGALKHRSINMLKAFIHHEIKKMNISRQRSESKIIYWTTPEKRVINKVFREHIKKKIYPSVAECQKAIEEFKELRNRNANRIRSFIQNLFRKM